MKLLAIARGRQDVDVRREVARHARDELRSLWRLYCDGVVREAYSPGGPGAVLILEAPSPQEAASALAGLPLVAGDVMEFEIIELLPFAAFELLFSSATRS